MPRIYPVILSGGSGTRLWPLSRSLFPKQFLPLASSRTLLQETINRVSDEGRFASPLIICNDQHRFVVDEQLRALNIKPKAIVLEPISRNTAAAVMIAAELIAKENSEACLFVLPSDHIIMDVQKFHMAMDLALKAAQAGWMVAFGMAPTRPETGYGYIRQGVALDGAPGVFAIEKFIEKPDAKRAQALLTEGGYLWNGGMYLFQAKRVIAEIKQYLPEVATAAHEALEKAVPDLNFLRLDKQALSEAPSISIDYGVMERTTHAAVIPTSAGWSDIGSWASLAETLPPDTTGNVASKDVILENTDNDASARLGLWFVL
ncbi:MAG: mannose-1-phosphate guanylyltransferase/mannose-6-phosphate isomerase [Alphaproteobacteria bacterium]